MTEGRTAIAPSERCQNCGGDAGNNWFDRSICPCRDMMHTRCRECGYALDGCTFDSSAEENVGG